MEPGTVWTFYHLEGWGGAGLCQAVFGIGVLHSDYRRTAKVENCESLVRLEYQSQITLHVSSSGTKCNDQKGYKPWYSFIKGNSQHAQIRLKPFRL